MDGSGKLGNAGRNGGRRGAAGSAVNQRGTGIDFNQFENIVKCLQQIFGFGRIEVPIVAAGSAGQISFAVLGETAAEADGKGLYQLFAVVHAFGVDARVAVPADACRIFAGGFDVFDGKCSAEKFDAAGFSV